MPRPTSQAGSSVAVSGVTLALAVALLFTAACASDKKGASSGSVKPPVSSSTAPTTTAAPTTAATTAAPPPSQPAMYFATHQEAADHLFQAWQNHDRAEALKGGTQAAVDTLFAVPPDGWYRYYNGGYCDTGEFDQGTCNFRSEDKYARVLSTHTPPGWQVTEIRISDGL